MTVECEDYLSALSFDLDERMGIAISHWDNSDGRSDFEFNYAPAPQPGSCDGDFSVTQIKVEIDGSNEEPEEDKKEDET